MRSALPRRTPAPVERITAYAGFTLSSTFDASVIVMLADPRLREQMTAGWHRRIEAWMVIEEDPRTGLDSPTLLMAYSIILIMGGVLLIEVGSV